MEIKYIHHSSFLIEFEDAYFLFDYFKGEIPPIDENKKIYIFSSHRHQDHFSWKIFSLFKNHEVKYILSEDIRKKYNRKYFMKQKVEKEYEDILFVKEKETYTWEGLQIETLHSTDEGVAFIVRYQDKELYYAGDLNLWTWDEESEESNQKMEEAYFKEIKNIENRHFDVAFVVLDPRQETNFYKGFDYFMKHTFTDLVYPMHMWEDYSVIDRLIAMEESSSYRHKIQKIAG